MNTRRSTESHRRPAAVLWDMDGTIVDTEAHWIAAAAEILHSHGIEPRPSDLAPLVGMALTDGAELMRDLGVDVPVGELVERQLELAMHNTAVAGLSWRPGALTLMAALRAEAIPLALVTMSYRKYADAIISALPEATFDVVVTGDDVQRGKPFPDAYLRAAEMLGVEPGDCVAIEDSLIGLAAARAAGAHTIGVPHHVALPADAADIVLPTLAGLASGDVRVPPVLRS